VYSGKEIDSAYLADKATPAGVVQQAAAEAASGTLSAEAQVAAGKALFQGTCSACHQAEGQGLPSVFPPLAKSDVLNGDKKRAIGIVINGLTGSVTVNGMTYNSVMPPLSQLNDDEIANILTYVYSAWGNSKQQVSAGEVTAVRSDTQAQRPEGAAH
jgi:nitrite reductase (NO-forming)